MNMLRKAFRDRILAGMQFKYMVDRVVDGDVKADLFEADRNVNEAAHRLDEAFAASKRSPGAQR